MTEPTVTSYKQLRRTTDDRVFAGVCGGLGRYFGIDPVVVRVGFAVLAIVTGGAALLAYPVMWLIMPEGPQPAAPVWPNPADPAWGQPTTPVA
ncbi:PspC domain-containing protein [Krasilnikovia sp. MM14-A1259]|uniref:PspC domain-containing protein n=1 Tax=Krasilnikovia sp. MM14-A1259 TaxID=3373539 RepID=UPI003810FE0A